jgi:hypothetical protein
MVNGHLARPPADSYPVAIISCARSQPPTSAGVTWSLPVAIPATTTIPRLARGIGASEQEDGA